jgi:hypothetical protein
MANSPDSGSLDQGAEELFMPGWLLSGEPDTHTRQPDTSWGELKLDQPVVRLVRPNPPPATMGTPPSHGFPLVLVDGVPV